MSGKTILKLIGAAFVLELLILGFMGGFSPNAGHPAERWFSAGPVEFYRYGFALDVTDDLGTLNLDGTPEGQTTFWAINMHTVSMILIVDAIMLLGAILIARALRDVPGRLQGFFEIVFDFFREIITETLGRHGDRHIPTIVSLFFFIWISNLIGVVPLLHEPTRDVNVPIGQMLVMILIVHTESIRVKGIRRYLKDYVEPFFIMAPLNVIGELAKGVSLSFRLFGNIAGGSIIILVISYLFRYTIMPVGLNLFFGIFVGTVQAFVFTMLSLTYIAVAVAEE